MYGIRWVRQLSFVHVYTLEGGTFDVFGGLELNGSSSPKVYVWASGGSERAHRVQGGMDLDEARDMAAAIAMAEELIAAEYAKIKSEQGA